MLYVNHTSVFLMSCFWNEHAVEVTFLFTDHIDQSDNKLQTQLTC